MIVQVIISSFSSAVFFCPSSNSNFYLETTKHFQFRSFGNLPILVSFPSFTSLVNTNVSIELDFHFPNSITHLLVLLTINKK